MALFFSGMSGAAATPSIDCASAVLNHSERAVCASAPLRALAASMDARYPRVADGLGVKQGQLEWMRVRDRCNGNTACLTTAYRERNAYLAGLPVVVATVGAPPAAEPVRHLFLRHAPAQLLSPSPAAPAAPSTAVAAAGNQPPRAADPAAANGRPPRSNTLWLSGGVLLAAILLWQMLTNVCGKCPNCHHWFARVEIDRRPLAGDASETDPHRRPGLRARTAASAMTDPGRGCVAAVRHFNQCRICLHEWETITQEAT